jgi:hypothetical protein
MVAFFKRLALSGETHPVRPWQGGWFRSRSTHPALADGLNSGGAVGIVLDLPFCVVSADAWRDSCHGNCCKFGRRGPSAW